MGPERARRRAGSRRPWTSAAVMATYREALVVQEQTINLLNVYPVPTGTPARTCGARSTRSSSPSPARAGRPRRSPSLSARRAARRPWNSGIILAQFLRAFVGSPPSGPGFDPAALSVALGAASDAARRAVSVGRGHHLERRRRRRRRGPPGRPMPVVTSLRSHTRATAAPAMRSSRRPRSSQSSRTRCRRRGGAGLALF